MRHSEQLRALAHDPAAVRRRIEAAERLLEGLFVVPGINRLIGLDVILDAIPASARSPRPRWAGGS